MAAMWNHSLSCPQLYVAGKAQLSNLPNFLPDLTAAEHSLVRMAWDAILALPIYGSAIGSLRFMDYGSARFVFFAQAGVVVAQGAEAILTQ